MRMESDNKVLIEMKPLMQTELNARAAVVKVWLAKLEEYNSLVDELGRSAIDPTMKHRYNECLKAYTEVNRFGFENGIL